MKIVYKILNLKKKSIKNKFYIRKIKKKENFILKNLNLEISIGDKIGILGKSGVGKVPY